MKLEHGPVPEHSLSLPPRRTSYGRRPERDSGRLHFPAPAQRQVRAKHNSAPEAKHQILSECGRRLEHPAVQQICIDRGLRPRMRRRDADPLAYERLERAGSAVNRVAL